MNFTLVQKSIRSILFSSVLTLGVFVSTGYASESFDSDNITLHSWVNLADFGGAANASDCWGYTSPSGREYALIGLFSELAVVEISDPYQPVIVGSIPHAGSIWADVKVYQDVVYVSNENGGGIDVIDLAHVDKGVVSLVQRMTVGCVSYSHNIAVDEESGFLYLAGANNGGRLVAYDLSDPRYPTLAGKMTSGDWVHDAQIVTYTDGPYAGKQICFGFAPGNGVYIIDVTNKANMSLISTATYQFESHCHQGWLSEDRQYLYVNDEADNRAETLVFDVSNLSNPVELNRFGWGADTIDHNLYVKGNLLFEANFTSGLRVLDLGADPVNPPLIAYFDTWPEGDQVTFNSIWSCFPYFDSGIVIGSDFERGLFIWSVGDSDPCEAPVKACATDVDGDGTVRVSDILKVVDNWGTCGDGTFRPVGDVDGSCCVNVQDLLELINDWGEACVVTGACCLDDYTNCSELSETACANMGGSYYGDNRLCENTICPRAGDEANIAIVAHTGENLFSTEMSTPSNPQPDDNMCWDSYLEWNNSPDVWFIWTADFSGNAHFTTCDVPHIRSTEEPEGFDSSIVLYAGSSNNQVACNGDGPDDSSCQDYYSSIDYSVQIGESYYIRIGGFDGETGAGTLTIE